MSAQLCAPSLTRTSGTASSVPRPDELERDGSRGEPSGAGPSDDQGPDDRPPPLKSRYEQLLSLKFGSGLAAATGPAYAASPQPYATSSTPQPPQTPPSHQPAAPIAPMAPAHPWLAQEPTPSLSAFESRHYGQPSYTCLLYSRLGKLASTPLSSVLRDRHDHLQPFPPLPCTQTDAWDDDICDNSARLWILPTLSEPISPDLARNQPQPQLQSVAASPVDQQEEDYDEQESHQPVVS